MDLIKPLRKHAYSNTLNILQPKKEIFQIKKKLRYCSDIVHIKTQIVGIQRGGCNGYPPPQRGGSNEYPQSIIFSRNKKNNIYPCKPQFYYIKVGFTGVKII